MMKRFRRLALAFLLIGNLLTSGVVFAQDGPNTPEDQLFRAIGPDGIPRIKALLAKGVSLNAPNSFHTPPLVEAARRGLDVSLLRFLLDNNADINGTDALGNTPLLEAAGEETYDTGQESRVEAIKLLLDRGANIAAKNKQGETAIMRAMQPGHYRIVRLLMERGADINVKTVNPISFAPLHYAAYANDADRVKMLLRSGADVNAPSFYGTPLILAAEDGSVPILQALLDAGADINAKSDIPYIGTALLSALHFNNIEAAQFLVAHGANVNLTIPEQGGSEDTPLLLALRISDAEVEVQSAKVDALIGAMLEKGANVNVVRLYETPLSAAIQREQTNLDRHVNWIKPILDKGANVNAKIESYGSALHVAIDRRRKNLDTPTLLIERGADVNAVNGEKVSVLMSAITQEDFAMAKLLVERGAKVQTFDQARKTPLLWAAFYGQMDLVKLLLAHGADIKAKDALGQTAPMLAQKGGFMGVAAFLKANGGIAPPADRVPTNALGQVVARLPLHLLASDNKAAAPITFSLLDGLTAHVPPALVLKKGGQLYAERVNFDTLFTGTTLWTLEERNDIHYQVQRGYYSPDAYQFFGLVTTKQGTFLGVYWYSPAASDQHQFAQFVFSLRVKGDVLELNTLLKSRGGTDDNLTRYSPIPLLSKSPTGTLLLIDWDGRFEYQPNGKWRKVGPAPKFDEKTGRNKINPR